MNIEPADHAWEDWQLTAYVLGELDQHLAEQIATAAEGDAELAAEIAAIGQTLQQVTQVLSHEPATAGLGDAGLNRILVQATASAANPPTAVSPDMRRANVIRHRRLWGLLATSAAVLLIAWLSLPTLQRWNLSLLPDDDGQPSKTYLPEEVQQWQLSSEPRGKLEGTAAGESAGQLAALREYVERSELEKAPTVSMDMREEVLAEKVASVPPVVYPTAEARSELSKRGANPMAANPTAASQDSPGGPASPTTASGVPSTSLATALPASTPQATGALPAQPATPYYDAGAGGYGGIAGGQAGGPGMGIRGLGEQPASQPPQEAYRGSQPGTALGGYGEPGPGDSAGMGMGGGGMGGMGGAGMGGETTLNYALDIRHLYGPAHPINRFGDEEASVLGRRRYQPPTSGDRFEAIHENEFERVAEAPLSTFSIDVDTASFAKTRQLLMEAASLPPPAAVRLEEFINYFDYQYEAPGEAEPFAAHLALAVCPWRPEHRLVRVALQAPKIEMAARPLANIVFLLDVSGSMNEPNKLPLVKESMRMLIEQLGENDQVAMVVYAGAAGCVLPSTRGDKQVEILAALDRLQAGGSTNGGDGIALAYNIARENFIPGGINRVILCTDGDFNVGVTDTEALVNLVAENARSKTFLTVLGYGMGNTNDAMMEQISNRGNGVYAFVDSWREAKRQMVQQLAGNLMTVAKDVKIQVEFNPHKIQSYRLLGYENRIMAAEDFNNDQKDAGEIGAGHRVTALYEVVPVGALSDADRPLVDDLRYQPKPTIQAESAPATEPDDELHSEWLAVKLRYKQPEGDVSQLRVFPLEQSPLLFAEADADFRWAASMAEFGMLLRGSRFRGNATWSGLIQQATQAASQSTDPQREECLQMIRRAAQLSGQ